MYKKDVLKYFSDIFFLKNWIFETTYFLYSVEQSSQNSNFVRKFSIVGLQMWLHLPHLWLKITVGY